MRAFKTFASYLGTLIAFGLAACDAETCDGDIEFVSVCYNDAQEEVPCCGPAGEKYACPPDAGDDADADAGDDADAGEDDGGPEAGSSSSCPEHAQCMPQGGGGWDKNPSFVWMGKETDPPPLLLNGMAWHAWVDVVFAEPACPVCSCAAPASGCVVPDAWSAKSTACQDNTPPNVTSFDAPVGWDGTCTPANPISAGAMCDGAPCVRSLWVEPPLVAPCVPEPALPPEGQALPPPTRTKVIEYPAAEFGTCDGLNVCILDTPPGYQLCLVGHGLQVDHPCPDAWPERHTGWEVAEEKRFCSACNCGPMQGASCEVLAKAYSDGACGQELASMTVTSTLMDGCVNLPLGAALGSKTAELVSYKPGACEATGGELMGDPLTEWPVTYCCLPEIAPPP